MKPIKLVTPISGDPDAPTQNLLGLGALAAELAAEGVSVRDLFARTGVDAGAARRCPCAHLASAAARDLPQRQDGSRSDPISACWPARGNGSATTASTATRWFRSPHFRRCAAISRSITSPWPGPRSGRSASGSTAERPPSCAATASTRSAICCRSPRNSGEAR